MKKSNLYILLIIGGGCLSIFGLAYGTVLSDTSAIINNLTVTGSCSGCGGSGSFSTWALTKTIEIHETSSPNQFLINNDGSMIAEFGSTNYYVMNTNGIATENRTDFTALNNFISNTQSTDNKYILFTGADGIGHTYSRLYNSQSFVQWINSTSPIFSNNVELFGISPNGQYVGIVGNNNPRTLTFIEIYKGT